MASKSHFQYACKSVLFSGLQAWSPCTVQCFMLCHSMHSSLFQWSLQQQLAAGRQVPFFHQLSCRHLFQQSSTQTPGAQPCIRNGCEGAAETGRGLHGVCGLLLLPCLALLPRARTPILEPSPSFLLKCWVGHPSHSGPYAASTVQAHPRRIARVASQMQREVSNLFVTDQVRAAVSLPL